MGRFKISAFTVLVLACLLPHTGFAHGETSAPPRLCSCSKYFEHIDIDIMDIIPAKADKEIMLRFRTKVKGLLIIEFVPVARMREAFTTTVQVEDIAYTIDALNITLKETGVFKSGDHFMVRVTARDMDGRVFHGCFDKK